MTDSELGHGLTCFIIGPIGDRLEPPGSEGRLRYENATQLWENVFEPGCAVFGLVPIRADRIAESGEIPEQIFTYLRDADIVIADLTAGNANVMYELGLRHTRDKMTVQIGEHERLPFDVNTIRTVKFKRTEAGLIDARNALIEALRAVLVGDGTPVTATRVWNEVSSLDPGDVASAAARSFTSDDPADEVEDEGPGRLDLMATGEMAMEALSPILEEFSELSEEMGQIMTEATPGMADASDFKTRLTILKQMADDLKPIASKFDGASSEYLSRVEEVNAMMGILVEEFGDDADALSSPETEEFREGLKTLDNSISDLSVSISETLPVTREMRRWSNLLRPVSKSLEHSMNTILRANALINDWAVRFRELQGWVEPEPDDQD